MMMILLFLIVKVLWENDLFQLLVRKGSNISSHVTQYCSHLLGFCTIFPFNCSDRLKTMSHPSHSKVDLFELYFSCDLFLTTDWHRSSSTCKELLHDAKWSMVTPLKFCQGWALENIMGLQKRTSCFSLTHYGRFQIFPKCQWQFSLHNVSGPLLKALQSVTLFCSTDTIVVNGILLGMKNRIWLQGQELKFW